jgi:hypothetical protein
MLIANRHDETIKMVGFELLTKCGEAVSIGRHGIAF